MTAPLQEGGRRGFTVDPAWRRFVLTGLIIAILALAGALAATIGGDAVARTWFGLHGLWGLLAVLGGLHAFHGWTLRAAGSPTLAWHWAVAAHWIAAAALTGGLLLLSYTGGANWFLFVGFISLAAGGVTAMLAVNKVRLSDSLVTDDPLTKGDDACMKHVAFAYRFLPLGLVLMAIGTWPAADAWLYRAWLAGLHVLLIGFGLLSVYGIGHYWVPRFSGIPAIAAGAIKGELHSTMLGLTLMLPGILFDVTGLIIAGGAFVFLGFFTFMGVLGANIMKNKSRTARVTPEFAYVPWTFSGVFWLISAVLVGLFLNAVPPELADRAGGLRFAHVHAGLLAGMLQLGLGWWMQIRCQEHNVAPPPFARMKWPFYAFNVGFVLAVVGRLRSDAADPLILWGAGLIVAALGLFTYLHADYFRRHRVPAA